MDKEQIDALKQSLIIRPLVFKKDQEKYGSNLKFVEPYYVDKNKPPITIPELKQMKSLLKTLEKTQRGVYRAKRKIYKTLRTKSESIPINNEDKEVPQWLKENEIEYNSYSRKSLNDAIKKCEQKLAELKKTNKQKRDEAEKRMNYLEKQITDLKSSNVDAETTITQLQQKIENLETKINPIGEYGEDSKTIKDCERAIEYLKKLKQIKLVGAGVSLHDLSDQTAGQLKKLQCDLKLPRDKHNITDYIPKSLVYLLPLDKGEIPASTEPWWPPSGPPLKKFPYSEYEDACNEFVRKIQEQVLDYHMTVTSQNSDSVEMVKYKTKRTQHQNEVETAQKSLTQMLPTLDEIAKTTDKVIEKIRPLMEDLDRRSLKARAQGLSSLYTRLNQELGQGLDELIQSTKNIKDLKASAMSACLGLNRILNKNTIVKAISWRDFDKAFNTVSEYNALTENICRKLEKNAMFGSRDELENINAKLTNYVKLITDYIQVDSEDLKQQMNKNLVSLGDNLTAYATKLDSQLTQAKSKLESFQYASGKAELLLQKLRSTKLGKLLLFKEAYTAELNTLKQMTDLVKTTIQSLPL